MKQLKHWSISSDIPKLLNLIVAALLQQKSDIMSDVRHMFVDTTIIYVLIPSALMSFCTNYFCQISLCFRLLLSMIIYSIWIMVLNVTTKISSRYPCTQWCGSSLAVSCVVVLCSPKTSVCFRLCRTFSLFLRLFLRFYGNLLITSFCQMYPNNYCFPEHWFARDITSRMKIPKSAIIHYRLK